eukprot:scaffold15171_cov140-Skeletonema_dohrnii-CCMP3373.AAC.1
MVAMRTARDLTVALRTKLKNVQRPDRWTSRLLLRQRQHCQEYQHSIIKHNSVNSHIINESAAAGILRVTKIPTTPKEQRVRMTICNIVLKSMNLKE